jgi:hypothetical protein
MQIAKLAQPRKTPVVIAGRNYDLCGDFGPLVEAEAYFAQRIHGFNLAEVLFTWGQDHEHILNGARKLLPCALRPFHSEVSYDDAQRLLDGSLAADDPSILKALWNMFPAKTKEIQAVHENLRCDLESLAEANEFFEGKPGLMLICVEGEFTLGHVWRVFPCAVHDFRPELTLDEARQLMTIEGGRLVIGLLGLVNETASQETRNRFAERVAMVASEGDKEEFLFRVLAKKPWPRIAQA